MCALKRRMTVVGYLFCLAAAYFVVQLLATSAWAEVITFDDIDTSKGIEGQKGIALIPVHYHAAWLTWSKEWTVTDNQAYNAAYDNTRPFPSPPNALGNSGSQTVTLRSTGRTFTVKGAYFGAASEYDEACWATPSSLTVTGYKGKTVVVKKTFELAPGQMRWQDLELTGVDRVEFTVPAQQKWFLMDNLAITR